MTLTPMDVLLLRVGLPHEADGGRLLLTLASAPDAQEGNAAFILDLDFITLCSLRSFLRWRSPMDRDGA